MRLGLVDESAVFENDVVAVGQSDFRSLFERVFVTAQIDVIVGHKDKGFAVDRNFGAVDKFNGRDLGHDKAILSVVVDGGGAVGKRDDVAVANNRDVVRGDASENAVDDRDFRTVLKRKDSHFLNRVAIVTMGDFSMSPNSFDQLIFHAVDRRDRAVFNVDDPVFGINVNVLEVRNGDRRVGGPGNLLAVGKFVNIIVRIDPVKTVVNVFHAVNDIDRSRRNCDLSAVRIDEDPVRRVPCGREFNLRVNKELLARVNLVGRGDVDEEFTVPNDVGHAVGFEHVAVLKRDFAVVVAAGVDLNRFAQRNETVVRIDNVEVRGNNNGVVERNRRFDDVEIGGRLKEVVVLAEFLDNVGRIDGVTEEVIAFFVLFFHQPLANETGNHVFDRADFNVFNKNITR